MGRATQFGEGAVVTTVLEAKIARLARARGCSFAAAARLVGKRGALRRAARRRLAQGDSAVRRISGGTESPELVEGLTRLRSTWHWRRDFE